jgi:hypothetical protein
LLIGTSTHKPSADAPSETTHADKTVCAAEIILALSGSRRVPSMSTPVKLALNIRDYFRLDGQGKMNMFSYLNRP